MSSSAGSGGGAMNSGAGSIREAGGAFAQMGRAKEEQYFYNLQKEQMKGLKDTLERSKEAVHSSFNEGDTNQSNKKHE